MDIWSTFALLSKRRYLTALMMLLTLGGSLLILTRSAPFAEVSSPMVLLLPAGESPDQNPYTGGFENYVLAQLAVKNMTSDAVVERMASLGADPQYTVTADRTYSSAMIRVTAHHRNPVVARQTVAVVTAGVQAEVASLQITAGAPDTTLIRAVPLTAAPVAQFVAGSRIRPLLGLSLASVLATLGAVFLAEALSRRRALGPWSRPVFAGAPPWAGFVDAGESVADVPAEPTASSGGRRAIDAVDALTVFMVLLFLVPARLVFEPLGAAGTPANMWGLALLLWWVAHRFVPAQRPSIRFQPVRLGILFLAMAAVASYSAGFLRPIDVVEIFAADRGLISLAAWSGVALVACDGIRTRVRLHRLVDRLANAGAVLAGLGIVQFFTAFDIRPWLQIPFLKVNGDLELIFINGRAGFHRVAGTTDHPIEFSAVLAMILPLALHLAFHALPARRNGAWLRVALIAMAVPLSVSRTGILGLFVGGLILFVSWPAQRRWRVILLSPIFALGLQVLVPGLLGSLRSLFMSVGSDMSISGRTDDYAIAAGYFTRAPFLGRGWGTLLPDRYLLLDNQLLKTVLEGGLVATAALLAFFAVGIGAARGAYRRSPDTEGRQLGQTFAAVIAIAMVSFVTFDAFAFVSVPSTLFLVIGCAGALWRLTLGDRHAQAVSRPVVHSH